MPHFAEINTQTNEVLRVILAKSRLWCEYELDGTWVKTHKNIEGKNYAGLGYTYHQDKDNFSTPQPYPSWTLDDTCTWQPPIAKPEGSYKWIEETQSWDEDDLLT